MENEQRENQLLFLRLSIQYLQFVETVIKELLKQGNRRVVFSDQEITFEEFFEATKWSDQNIAEPLFFNLYHGIELLLKGYSIKPLNGHALNNLFGKFKKENKDKLISEILQKYIGSNEELVEPLKSFFVNNKINADEYYNALRYPLSKDRKKQFEHYELKKISDENISFYKELMDDISILRVEVVTFGRNIPIID